jgi:hypothetical protein
MIKPALSKFPPSFLLLQQEGFLISSCLSTGLTELRNAYIHNKGAFYTALFNLSIGFERLFKVIVIIDHMLSNSLSVPNKKQLQAYGHNIIDLYDTCEAIGNKRQSTIPCRTSLDAIHQDLLQFFNNFARTTRYHNLDALSASQNGLDPLSHWERIILAILDSDVPQKQQDKVLARANMVANSIDGVTFTLMHGLDQSPLTTVEALALPGLHNQAARFAVLRVINLLSPIRDLLGVLGHEAYGFNTPVPPFPQMQEFFQWLCNDRQYVLRKKKWP